MVCFLTFFFFFFFPDTPTKKVLGVPLANFCQEPRHARLKALFKSQVMMVADLVGFTAEGPDGFHQERQGRSAHGQIPSWLEQRVSETDDRTLRSFLKPDLKKVAAGEEQPTELFSMELCLALSDVQTTARTQRSSQIHR